jgi:transcriptional regulator with XRE-family HTH domain
MTRHYSDEEIALSEAFGAFVRQQRTARGFSQESFADHVRIHRTFQSLIERGLRTPTIRTAYKISVGLEMSMPELFTEVEKMQKKLLQKMKRQRAAEKAAQGAPAAKPAKAKKAGKTLAASGKGSSRK